MTDDEIVDRIVKMVRSVLVNLGDDPYAMSLDATLILDVSEAYRLAFASDVRDRAKMRREAARIRAKVFAALRASDRRLIEK